MSFENRRDIWFRFDGYTPYSYRKVLERLHSQNHFSELISLYAKKKIDDPPKALSREYLARTELSRQNVRFIENAMETYEAGLRASSHIKPILYYYSWHSFLAFLMFTFMRFNGRSGGHGITVSKMERDEIQLEFYPLERRGFFQRVLDLATILGYTSAFARWIPIVEKNGSLTFMENTLSPLADIKRMNLQEIITFDYYNYFEKLCAQERVIKNLDKYEEMEKCVRSFIMLFTASTITRYRPELWSEILEGEKEYASSILTEVNNSYETYLTFVTLMHNSLESFLR